MTAVGYLASKPTGAVLAFLIVALVLLGLAAIIALGVPPTRLRVPLIDVLVAAGLFFFVLAFTVST